MFIAHFMRVLDIHPDVASILPHYFLYVCVCVRLCLCESGNSRWTQARTRRDNIFIFDNNCKPNHNVQHIRIVQKLAKDVGDIRTASEWIGKGGKGYEGVVQWEKKRI